MNKVIITLCLILLKQIDVIANNLPNEDSVQVKYYISVSIYDSVNSVQTFNLVTNNPILSLSNRSCLTNFVHNILSNGYYTPNIMNLNVEQGCYADGLEAELIRSTINNSLVNSRTFHFDLPENFHVSFNIMEIKATYCIESRFIKSKYKTSIELDVSKFDYDRVVLLPKNIINIKQINKKLRKKLICMLRD